MKFAVITIGRSGSSELIRILNENGVDVIPKPFNHLYPSQLKNKFGTDIKVIFITRNIEDVIYSIKNREIDYGLEWVEQHYKNLNAHNNFKFHENIFNKDTLKLTDLFKSYYNNPLYEVLFIKYENLFFGHEETLTKLSEFVNCNINITYDENNKWCGSIKPKNRYDENYNKIQTTYNELINLHNSFDIMLRKKSIKLIDKIKLLKSNKDYRLGNLIFNIGHNTIKTNSIKNILGKNMYNNTILKKFLIEVINNNITNKNMKLKLLKNIVKIHSKNNKIPFSGKNKLVIHLRTGDIAKYNKKFLKDELLNKIFNFLDNNNNIKKVIFCTAFHYGDRDDGLYNYNETIDKLNKYKLEIFLDKIIYKYPNLIYTMRSNNNIDNDFCFLINSKNFIEDFGTFSQLIKEVKSIDNYSIKKVK